MKNTGEEWHGMGWYLKTLCSWPGDTFSGAGDSPLLCDPSTTTLWASWRTTAKGRNFGGHFAFSSPAIYSLAVSAESSRKVDVLHGVAYRLLPDGGWRGRASQPGPAALGRPDKAS